MNEIEIMIQTEEGARQLLAEIKYPNGTFLCAECEHTEAYKLNTCNRLECKNRECGKQTSLTVGTPFENLKLPIHLFFRVIYDKASGAGKCANQHAAELGIGGSTAWRWHLKVDYILAGILTASVIVDREFLFDVLFRRSGESLPKGTDSNREVFELDFTPRASNERKSISRTMDFIRSVHKGVSEKYSQLYAAEYNYIATEAHKGFYHLLAVLVKAGPVSNHTIESYSSPKFIRLPAF